MESSHKPEWASRLMETVQLDFMVRHSPLTTGDKELLRTRSVPCRKEEDYEHEDVYFWIDALYRGHGRHVFTTFAAYLKKYICHPDCCKNNASTVMMKVSNSENPDIQEKLDNGEKMLEKILQMDTIFFPDDKDKSIFGKIQFFYNIFGDCCISCGKSDEGECWTCASRRVQLEEFFHYENTWHNTGRRNIYTTTEPFYSRDLGHGFRVGLITQEVDENEWFSPERAAVRRFLGCSSRKTDRIPNLFLLCINTIVQHYRADEEKISNLPLPSLLKDHIVKHLSSSEKHVADDLLARRFPLFMRTRGCYYYTDDEDGISC